LELGQQQPSLTTLFKLAHALKCRPGRFIDLVESEMGEDGVSKLLLDDEAQAKEH